MVPAKVVTIAVVRLSEPAVVEVRTTADRDGHAGRVLDVAFLGTRPAAIAVGIRSGVEPTESVLVSVITLDIDIGLIISTDLTLTHNDAKSVLDGAILTTDVASVAFAPAVSVIVLGVSKTVEQATAEETLAQI